VTSLPTDVRERVVCPRCHGELVDDARGLRCDACRVVYPLESGIPVLLIDAALPIEPALD
jgi:uncharacterized protein YbaR (Trm112 family)